MGAIEGKYTERADMPVESDGFPLVSIVSVFHNRVDYVSASVESLLAQTYPRLEINLWDDGSTDGTSEALAAFNDPRLRVHLEPNIGFVRAINRTIKSSNGEIIALHGSGDISHPDRVVRQVEALLAAPRSVVGCIVDNSESLTGPLRKFSEPLSGNLHSRALSKHLPFTHGSAMFLRSLFEATGGYREYFELAQDRDLWLRMPADVEFRVIPQVLYYRRKPPGSVNTNAEKIILQDYLVELAVQCARSRDRGEVDLIERYGNLVGLVRQPSRSVAHSLSARGLRWLCFGDETGGRKLIAAAARERTSVRTVAASALSATSSIQPVWRVIRPLFRGMISTRAYLKRLRRTAGAATPLGPQGKR